MTPQERIESLEFQVRELKGEGLRWPTHWGLSPSHLAILRLLVTREIATKEALLMALYGDRDLPESDTLSIFLVRLGRKLAARGFKIRNQRGQGWYLIAADRGAIKRAAVNFILG